MRIGSLFTGVGGLELGLERAGLGPVIWQCEVDRICREQLARHWPNARRYRYVQALARDPNRLASVDLICGGFPCQDLSAANPGGAGLAGERSGLWFYMLDIIRAKRPRVVVIENVPRLVRRGLDTVLGGLFACGYTVEGTRLRAGDVGAPHRRERLFLVAYTHAGGLGQPQDDRALDPTVAQRGGGVANADGFRRNQGLGSLEDAPGERAADRGRALANPGRTRPKGRTGGEGPGARRLRVEPCGGSMANPDGGRREGQRISEPAGEQRTCRDEPDGRDGAPAKGTRNPECGLGGDAHGLSAGLDAQRWPSGRGEPQHEWEPPRTVRIGTDYEDDWRRWRLKSYGNAVLPQCAEIVGWRVRQIMAEV